MSDEITDLRVETEDGWFVPSLAPMEFADEQKTLWVAASFDRAPDVDLVARALATHAGRYAPFAEVYLIERYQTVGGSPGLVYGVVPQRSVPLAVFLDTVRELGAGWYALKEPGFVEGFVSAAAAGLERSWGPLVGAVWSFGEAAKNASVRIVEGVAEGIETTGKLGAFVARVGPWVALAAGAVVVWRALKE